MAVALMAVAMLATPVMAKKPVKQPLYVFGDYPPYPPNYREWVSGNILHTREIIGTVPEFWVVWDPNWDPEDNVTDKTLLGSCTQDWHYDANIGTLRGVIHADYEITLGAGTPDTSDDGTFKGTLQLVGKYVFVGENSEYVWFTDGRWHGVLHGTGAYRDWKIVIERIKIGGIEVSEDYIVIPYSYPIE